MLVLTRKLGEKILIGDDITITLVDIGKSRLKLGIKAPAGHHILRSELALEPEQSSSEPGDDDLVVLTEIVPRQRSRHRAAVELAAIGA